MQFLRLDRGVVKYCYDCLLGLVMVGTRSVGTRSLLIISVLLHESRSYYIHHASERTCSMTIPLPRLVFTNYIFHYPR